METLNFVSKETIEDICYSLDRLKGNVEYWRLLIPLLPKDLYRYNKVDIEQIARVGTRGRGTDSPSLKLLQDFQRKGMGLSYFKNMLKEVECQGALDCFEQPTIPVIHEQPESTTVIVNKRLELRCFAKCIPEPPDYQWFYYGNNTSVPIKGAKSWKFIKSNVTLKDTGQYCCRVQNKRKLKDKGYAVFSQYAIVNVQADKQTELETSGGSSCLITPIQEVSHPDISESTTSLTSSVEEMTDGMNNIIVSPPTESTDPVGSDQPIKIVEHPQSQNVRLTGAEEKITLHCRAESVGDYQLEYNWYYLRGGETPATLKKEKKSKCKRPDYEITLKSSIKQKFRYYCEVSVISEPEWCAPSGVAEITLEQVWFVEQPKKEYIRVTGTDSLKVSCRVETAPTNTVKYQWYKCEKSGNGKQPAGYYDSTMILPAVIASRGYYMCGVMSPSFDLIYSDVTRVELVNSVDITIKTQPPRDRYVDLDETLVIKFEAACKNHPVIYKWYRNGTELPDCTEPTLTIDSISGDHIGSYHCEASSPYSATSVMSEMCRVQWKANPSLSTINRQQLDAEEKILINDKVYATDKMALLIGNCNYKGQPLKCSRNDVEAVTKKLRQMNFKTISLVDLTLSQMAKAADYFCSLLDNGMYAVFYYSGHGVENQHNNRTYLMPIDASEPVKFDQCMNVDDITEKMQAKQSKVIMILDCCRINLPSSAVAATQLESLGSIDRSKGFSNLCQLFACSSSFETYENSEGDGCSYMTEALLQELDRRKSMMQVLSSVQNYPRPQPSRGKISPTPTLVLQMRALDAISFHDPILNEQKLPNKELLLVLPPNCCLKFTNAKLKNKYDKVELRFGAKFSNVLIVKVVCDATLQPEMEAELECDVQKEDDKLITSFKITDLLDVVQDETSRLQISFQMPEDSSAKETLEYQIPKGTIKPAFYHH